MTTPTYYRLIDRLSPVCDYVASPSRRYSWALERNPPTRPGKLLLPTSARYLQASILLTPARATLAWTSMGWAQRLLVLPTPE